jgi:hypothetical protein
MAITLKDVLEIIGSGEFLRITTKDGGGLLFHGRTINLYYSMPERIKNRQVYEMYSVDKRPGDYKCGMLDAGIMIVIDGEERGIKID